MAGSNYVARARSYAKRVISGEIPSCRLIVLMCIRWEKDLSRDDIYLDSAVASLVCGFMETLKHFKGLLSGQSLRLEDWQVFALVNIFGWKLASNRRRRFRYADILVPRKNGKTMLASGIALFMLFMDDEPGPEVYAAAVDREQAKLCFDGSKELLKGSMLQDVAKVRIGEIRYPDKAGVYKPLTKETKNKDGLNPHAAICDERHAWATNEIYDLIKTGMGARTQPLIFSISTAGMDTSLPYYADVQVLRDVLLGLKEKDNHFIMLYIPDEGDRYDDPVTWAKVNPNLGVSVSEEYMAAECAEAKMKGGSTLAAFCVKNLNMWVDAPTVWIPDDDVVANNAPFDQARLQGADCWVGIDFSRKTDILAVAFWFPQFNVARFGFVVPEAKIQETEDRVDYRRWYEQGWIVKSPGSVTDEDWFMTWLLGELNRYAVKGIAYDPWGMWNVLNKFGVYESKLLEYQQSIRYMSVPTKWMESAVLKHELNFLDNPVIRWMFRNVVIYTDPNANIKLDKSRARNKIDGVVALVNAIGGWLTKTSGKSGEIYRDHSLRVIKMG
jgi:phage terminase large subunit-like protein